MTEPDLKLKNVTKVYSTRPLLNMVSRVLRGAHGPESLLALDRVSFEVPRGDSLGIIGPNGAGKSTILKILSGVTRPTSGDVRIAGKIAPLIELLAGFHPELSGRENIFLNGCLLGMTRAEVKGKFDEIVDFSGLEHFLDMPVKRYSSGMMVRLGFSVAISTPARCLLIDEVLAVGDKAFRIKCLNRLKELVREGRTLILVSHHVNDIKKMCRRSIYLKEGRIAEEGDTHQVIEAYERDIYTTHKEFTFFGEGAFEILDSFACDSQGAARREFDTGEDIILNLVVDAKTSFEDPVPGFSLHDQDGNLISSLTSRYKGQSPGSILPGKRTLRVVLPANTLMEGRFTANFFIYDGSIEHCLLDADNLLSFRISGPPKDYRTFAGVMDLNCRFEIT